MKDNQVRLFCTAITPLNKDGSAEPVLFRLIGGVTQDRSGKSWRKVCVNHALASQSIIVNGSSLFLDKECLTPFLDKDLRPIINLFDADEIKALTDFAILHGEGWIIRLAVLNDMELPIPSPEKDICNMVGNITLDFSIVRDIVLSSMPASAVDAGDTFTRVVGDFNALDAHRAIEILREKLSDIGDDTMLVSTKQVDSMVFFDIYSDHYSADLSSDIQKVLDDVFADFSEGALPFSKHL